MSVLNILYTADRIELLSDTLQYAKGEPVGLTVQKVHTADRFAWCTRGRCWIGDTFDPVAARCVDLDEAEIAAASWIDSIAEDDLIGHSGIEVTVAGFSGRSGGLAVMQFSREHAKPVEAKVFEPGVYLLPSREGIPALPATVTMQQFYRLALAQHAAEKIGTGRGMDGMCIGGVMHLTTVTSAGADQRIVGLYPDYDQHAKAFGDPNAEEVAAFLAQQAAA
ncbi:hypothetical protein [Thalassobaculum sp.]|uniref:hypothetical protein n=1 Tax=Thalassobaculum sp. TaxID=2022740 RepID=UPI003B5A5858